MAHKIVSGLLLIKMLGNYFFKAASRSNHAKLQFVRLTSKQHFAASQLTHDVKRVANLAQEFQPSFEAKRGQWSSKLPDFDVSAFETANRPENLAIPVAKATPQEYEREHQFEISARERRAQANIFKVLKEDEVVLTNLPWKLEGTQLESEEKIRQLLKEHVHKDLHLSRATFYPAIETEHHGSRTAYIRLKVGSKRQVHLIQSRLRHFWIQDQLLKVKSSEDARSEQFDNRTVIIRGLPTHWTQSDILNSFTKLNSGCVIGLELPMQNAEAADLLAERRRSGENSEAVIKQEGQFNRAKATLEQALQLDAEFQDRIRESKGEEYLQELIGGDVKTQAAEVEREKLAAQLRIITTLQAENIQVLESKAALQGLQPNGSVKLSEEEFTKHFEQHKEELKRVMHLIKDSEIAAPIVGSSGDTLSRLYSLAQGELAHAYDSLIKALNQREDLIERRLQKQLKHLGIEERILFEKKNWTIELEDIQSPEVLGKLIKPEEILSINDQVNFVLNSKHMTAQQKLTELVRKTLNPFKKVNWDNSHLKHADHPHLHKYTEVHNFFKFNKTMLKMHRRGSDFSRTSRRQIDSLVEEYRNRYDLPFDELYHKEKGLVKAVVQAHKALKEKEKLIKQQAYEGQMIDKAEMQHLQRGSILDDSAEMQVLSSIQQKLHARLQKEGIDAGSLRSLSYLNSKQQRLHELVANGVLSQSELDTLKGLARSEEHRNLGYCFLTFSHADEARLMLMNNPKPYINHQRLEIDLKSTLDHGDLDVPFFFKRAKNDQLVMAELEQLRKARQELREFEESHEAHMPSHFKLKEFRKLAKDVIEGGVDGKARGARRGNRSDMEHERLLQKVRELEQKYPHIDVTQLFMTDKADKAQQTIHKAAFASYKANEFLKHAVKPEQQHHEKQSSAKKRLQEADPFDFPELDQTVAKVLAEDAVQPRISDHGDFSDRPGRRFSKMSDQEFLESYFGKDNMRNAVVDRNDDPLFLEQKTLKERFPLSMFLKGPDVERKKQQLLDLGIHADYKSINWNRNRQVVAYSSDPEIAAAQKLIDGSTRDDDILRDKMHPTKEGRTLLTDMEKLLTKYEETADKIDDDGNNFPIIDYRQLSKIRRALKNDYQPPTDDKWFKDLQKGEWRRPKPVEGEEADEQEAAKFNDQYDSHSDVEQDFKPKSQIDYKKVPKQLHPEEYKSADEFEGQGSSKRQLQHHEKFTKWQLAEDLKEQKARHHQHVHDQTFQRLANDQARQDRLNSMSVSQDPAYIRRSNAPHYFEAGSTDQDTHRINQEYVYSQRMDENFEKGLTKQRQDVARENDLDNFELLQKMSQQAHLREAGNKYGGEFTKAMEGGELRDPVYDESSSKPGKSLRSFIDQEREEEDIYEMYLRKIDERPRNTEEAQHMIDREIFDAEMPRLQDHVNQEQDGVHPFDRITSRINEELGEQAKDEYDDWDREMHQREIMGRLVGRKLTPRQFDVLSGQYNDVSAKLQWVKDANHKNFLDRRAAIAVATEQIEKHRRQMVLKGEWTEAESHTKIYDRLQEVAKLAPGPEAMRKINRYQEVIVDTMLQLETPEKIFEKEYHFDEGLGQTLDEHIQELKEKFPGMRVQTRRDRDGFPIVKTMFQKEYKYDLAKVESFDPEEEMLKMNETFETLLDAAYPGTAQETMESLTSNMEDFVQVVQQNQSLDNMTKLQIHDLCQKKINGQISNEELAKRFLEIAASANVTNEQSDQLDAFRALTNDRELMRHEIHEQLALRMRNFLIRQERKKSDFIKTRVDESVAYSGQVHANDVEIAGLEQSVSNADENFDRAAFDEMKAEISRRKEAKERLLGQRLPEFEAYLRL